MEASTASPTIREACQSINSIAVDLAQDRQTIADLWRAIDVYVVAVLEDSIRANAAMHKEK